MNIWSPLTKTEDIKSEFLLGANFIVLKEIFTIALSFNCSCLSINSFHFYSLAENLNSSTELSEVESISRCNSKDIRFPNTIQNSSVRQSNYDRKKQRNRPIDDDREMKSLMLINLLKDKNSLRFLLQNTITAKLWIEKKLFSRQLQLQLQSNEQEIKIQVSNIYDRMHGQNDSVHSPWEAVYQNVPQLTRDNSDNNKIKHRERIFKHEFQRISLNSLKFREVFVSQNLTLPNALTTTAVLTGNNENYAKTISHTAITALSPIKPLPWPKNNCSKSNIDSANHDISCENILVPFQCILIANSEKNNNISKCFELDTMILTNFISFLSTTDFLFLNKYRPSSIITKFIINEQYSGTATNKKKLTRKHLSERLVLKKCLSLLCFETDANDVGANFIMQSMINLLSSNIPKENFQKLKISLIKNEAQRNLNSPVYLKEILNSSEVKIENDIKLPLDTVVIQKIRSCHVMQMTPVIIELLAQYNTEYFVGNFYSQLKAETFVNHRNLQFYREKFVKNDILKILSSMPEIIMAINYQTGSILNDPFINKEFSHTDLKNLTDSILSNSLRNKISSLSNIFQIQSFKLAKKTDIALKKISTNFVSSFKNSTTFHTQLKSFHSLQKENGTNVESRLKSCKILDENQVSLKNIRQKDKVDKVDKVRNVNDDKVKKKMPSKIPVLIKKPLMILPNVQSSKEINAHLNITKQNISVSKTDSSQRVNFLKKAKSKSNNDDTRKLIIANKTTQQKILDKNKQKKDEKSIELTRGNNFVQVILSPEIQNLSAKPTGLEFNHEFNIKEEKIVKMLEANITYEKEKKIESPIYSKATAPLLSNHQLSLSNTINSEIFSRLHNTEKNFSPVVKLNLEPSNSECEQFHVDFNERKLENDLEELKQSINSSETDANIVEVLKVNINNKINLEDSKDVEIQFKQNNIPIVESDVQKFEIENLEIFHENGTKADQKKSAYDNSSKDMWEVSKHFRMIEIILYIKIPFINYLRMYLCVYLGPVY